ncbi:MAG: nucleoside-diphosphate kinase [Nanoarchaeota archaeon]|nr:nucleoside-diphosphate kinase [Nanoarchaeota archaeon]
MERTLVLIKPEGVQRHLVGKIIQRFEDASLKIIGMKQVWADKEFAKKHYTEDIAERRGEKVREMLLDYITEGPVIAICLEGVDAIENVRKIVGGTEPRNSPPGTIRGDFAHVSFAYADKNNLPVKNLIHASSDETDAKREVALWFSEKELHSYKSIQDLFM